MNVKEYTFFQKLEKLPFIEKIWLYGSRAREDSRDRSDIDLAIECPNASFMEWQQLLDIIEDADTLLKIDCVRLEQLDADSSFKKNILGDAKLLFQKTGEPMTESRWKKNFTDLGRALERLKEALETPMDEHCVVMDGTIQRFEFCIELYWKNFKNLLEREERKVLSPRDAVAQAYQMQWFDNEELWLKMLHDRNAMSHNYEKNNADEVYARVKTYYTEMKAIYEKLRQLYVSSD